jgi:very-short-patch-repair endonuclease
MGELLSIFFGALALLIWWISKPDKAREDDESLKSTAAQDFPNDFTKELEALTDRAEAGDPASMYEFGELKLYGRGVGRDRQCGLKWIENAARLDEPRALFKIGETYMNGLYGFQSDKTLGLEYLQNAERLGHKSAANLIKKIERRAKEKETRRSYGNSTTHWEISEFERFSAFILKCESPAEEALLKSLIDVAKLVPSDDGLAGEFLLQQQITALSYRVDFLIDKKLVIEVDGYTFHSGKESFELDRQRDQDLILAGFLPMRFSASQVFKDPDSVAEKIINAVSKVRINWNGRSTNTDAAGRT